ncbi:MAG: lamin tail domain-containing protein [Anaerolineae bacterium]|nr:lamin tail domain-containing protein [Anaerolineae bacterium]
MARRSLFTFLFLNVLVTFAVVFLFNLVLPARAPSQPTFPASPLVVIVTATPNPNEPPPVTVIVVTATGQGQASAGSTPAVALNTTSGVPTLDPALLPETLGTVEPPTLTPTDPSGCPTYTIQKGDVPSTVANSFGISTADLLKANDLTEQDATRLQIGQVLIIPVNGCGLQNTATPTLTPTRVILPTQPPTSTTAPTAASTQLEIMGIVGAGDITSEGIEIRNNSADVINIENWTLTDSNGNTFTFPNYQMFSGRRVIVYTRAGNNTPFALFWGLSSAIWTDANSHVVIKDTDGAVQVDMAVADIGSTQAVPTPTAP